MYQSSLDYAQDIEPHMRGQWNGFIAQEIGIEPVTEGRGKGKGHECPICGGNDRAHFREKDGRVFLFCRGACGNTNSTWGSNTCATPEYLCMTAGGYDFPSLVDRCADWLGIQRHENVSRKNSPSLTPKIEGKRNAPTQSFPKNPHFESRSTPSRQTPINAILSVSELLPWHRIGYCQKNALSGAEGEFLAVSDGGDGFDLLVPLFLEVSGRVVMTGAVQITENGKTLKHGSCSGSFATISHGYESDISVFATDYAAADFLSRSLKCKSFYSPSTNAFAKCGASHVFLNTIDPENIDRANAIYGRSPTYIIPKGDFSRDSMTAEFEFLSYDECQAIALEHESGE